MRRRSRTIRSRPAGSIASPPPTRRYYPLPNRPGTVSNYFTNQLRPVRLQRRHGPRRSQLHRHQPSVRDHLLEQAPGGPLQLGAGCANATDGGVINGFEITKGFDYRTNAGTTGGFTSALRANLLLDMRGSWSRFGEYRDPSSEFDPSSLGFSAAALRAMGDYNYLPLMTLGTFSTTNESSTIASLGSRRSDWGDGFDRPLNTYSFAPTVTRVWGSHTPRAGYDLRLQEWDDHQQRLPGRTLPVQRRVHPRQQHGGAQRSRAVMGAVPPRAADVGHRCGGDAGTQSSQFEIASPGSFTQVYHHFFVQDDWRVSPS